jgi:CheY-like chemotaxis protein
VQCDPVQLFRDPITGLGLNHVLAAHVETHGKIEEWAPGSTLFQPLSADPLAKPMFQFHFRRVTGDATLLPILITDDESEDRFFLQKALRKAGVKNPILEFRDGADLLTFLEQQTTGDKSLNEITDLLFLDLKMPLVDGFDTMRWIRDHPVLKFLHVVIVSSSSLPRDQEQASQLGAFRYLEKYPSSEVLAQVVAECSGSNPHQS